MGMFDFGAIKEVKATAGGSYLRPWDIYEGVKFDGISDVIKGQRQDGSEWHAWDFKFTCDKGSYTERIFEPENNERRSYKDKNGKERQFPSNHESNLVFVTQVLNAFNPKGLETLREKAGKIDGYTTLIALVGKLLDGSTKTTKLKIVGRERDGKVYSALPTYCSVDDNGVARTSATFVGDTVAFSAWEVGKKKEYDSAAPTNMAAVTKNEEAAESTDTSVDDLLNDI